MSPSLPRTGARLLASTALVLAVFAVPLWTVSSHAPVELVQGLAEPEPQRHAVFHLPEPPPDDVPAEVDASEVAETEVVEAEPPEPAPPLPPPARPTPTALATAEPLPAPQAVASSSPAAEPAPKKRTRRRPRRDCRPDVPEIESTGRSQWTVARDLVDRYARDLDAAARLAFVGWARDADERIVGFKVHKVRCGSPLHEAGFRNGDVITRINGHKVRSVPQALAAYVALRVKRKLRVRGHRADGTPLDHRYRLT